MSNIGQWIETLRSLVGPSGSKIDEFIDSKINEMRSFYVVIEEVCDEDGNTIEYLYQYKFPTFIDALQKMKEDGRYSHIDYWDGDEWWFDVQENMEAMVDMGFHKRK